MLFLFLMAKVHLCPSPNRVFKFTFLLFGFFLSLHPLYLFPSPYFLFVKISGIFLNWSFIPQPNLHFCYCVFNSWHPPRPHNVLTYSFLFLFCRIFFMSKRILILGFEVGFFWLFFSAMCLFLPSVAFPFVCFYPSCLRPSPHIWWYLDNPLVCIPEGVK